MEIEDDVDRDGRLWAWPSGWSVREASSRAQRTRGLLGSDGLAPFDALWLPVRSVHTVGMRFPLDLVWLDRRGTVLRTDLAVGRRRVRTCVRAAGGVVELGSGRGAPFAQALAGARLAGGARPAGGAERRG